MKPIDKMTKAEAQEMLKKVLANRHELDSKVCQLTMDISRLKSENEVLKDRLLKVLPKTTVDPTFEERMAENRAAAQVFCERFGQKEVSKTLLEQFKTTPFWSLFRDHYMRIHS